MAALTAICCMSGMAALTANAEMEIGGYDKYLSYEETEDNEAYFRFGDRVSEFLIVTDGTAPTEEELETELLNDVWEYYMGFPEFTLAPSPYNTTQRTMSAELEAELAAYGENTKVFKVNVDRDFGDCALILTRKFMIEHDYVLDIIQLTADHEGTASWNGSFYCKFKEDMDSADLFDHWNQIKGSGEIAAVLQEYERHNQLELTLSVLKAYAGMTEEEEAEFRTENSMLTSYEMIDAAFKAAQSAMEEHSDEVELISPNFAFGSNQKLNYYKSSNLWDGCGDFDENAEVNAADAAAILAHASKAGSSHITVRLTDAQYDAGDVNCDGYVNSSDAAKVLEYAAAAGTQDGGVHWMEILAK